MKTIWRNQRGDTIMEVILCTAIVGLILSAAFVLASRNSASTLMAQERSAALKITETQIERMKAFSERMPLPAANKYVCMVNDAANPSGLNWKEMTSAPDPDINADNLATYPAECRTGPDNLYSFIIWSPDVASPIGADAARKPYGITVRWESANGKGREELKSFYTLYDNPSAGFGVDPSGGPPACSNGIDDDGDGKIDSTDPGCSGALDTDEANPQCANGGDDDGDGLTDMADPGCSSPSDNDEYNPPPPTHVEIETFNKACSNMWSARLPFIANDGGVTAGVLWFDANNCVEKNITLTKNFNSIQVRVSADVYPEPSGFPTLQMEVIDSAGVKTTQTAVISTEPGYVVQTFPIIKPAGTYKIVFRMNGDACGCYIPAPGYSITPADSGTRGPNDSNNTDRNLWLDWMEFIHP